MGGSIGSSGLGYATAAAVAVVGGILLSQFMGGQKAADHDVSSSSFEYSSTTDHDTDSDSARTFAENPFLHRNLKPSKTALNTTAIPAADEKKDASSGDDTSLNMDEVYKNTDNDSRSYNRDIPSSTRTVEGTQPVSDRSHNPLFMKKTDRFTQNFLHQRNGKPF